MLYDDIKKLHNIKEENIAITQKIHQKLYDLCQEEWNVDTVTLKR